MVLGDRVAVVPNVERDPRTDRAVDAVAEGADLNGKDGGSVRTAVPLDRALPKGRGIGRQLVRVSKEEQTHERNDADSRLMDWRKVGEVEGFAANRDEHVVRIAIQRGSCQLLRRVDVLFGTLREKVSSRPRKE